MSWGEDTSVRGHGGRYPAIRGDDNWQTRDQDNQLPRATVRPHSRRAMHVGPTGDVDPAGPVKPCAVPAGASLVRRCAAAAHWTSAAAVPRGCGPQTHRCMRQRWGRVGRYVPGSCVPVRPSAGWAGNRCCPSAQCSAMQPSHLGMPYPNSRRHLGS